MIPFFGAMPSIAIWIAFNFDPRSISVFDLMPKILSKFQNFQIKHHPKGRNDIKNEFIWCMKWVRLYWIANQILFFILFSIFIESQVGFMRMDNDQEKGINPIEIQCFIIFWALIWTQFACTNVLTILIPTIISYFICSFCGIQAEQFNQDVIEIGESYKTTSHSLMNHERKLDNLISSHNQICSTIKYYNQFCSKYYFIAFISVIPLSLIIVITIMSNDSIFLNFLFCNFCILSWLFIFFISFMSARVTKAIHSSHEALAQLQWHLNVDLLHLKIKLESTFERTIEKNRIIGFSVLDLFTLNFFRFAWIVILYARFSLIAYKFINKISKS
jgi:hypothetical protein